VAGLCLDLTALLQPDLLPGFGRWVWTRGWEDRGEGMGKEEGSVRGMARERGGLRPGEG